MSEPSKRERAGEEWGHIVVRAAFNGGVDVSRVREAVGLIVDAAKEEMRREDRPAPAASPASHAPSSVCVPEASIRLIAWLLYGKRGASSNAMAEVLGVAVGLYPRGLEPPAPPPGMTRESPADAADFALCIALLDAVPELRPHLHLMAGECLFWGPIVARWDELEALSRADPRTATRVISAIRQDVMASWREGRRCGG